MDNGRVISSADEIDLCRHGIIEAHAGTGKTYTIVKLVLRMLEQPSDIEGKFVHLRDILLVTYTEKAAGELKKRIQEGIAPRIKGFRAAGNDILADHLENCLNNMHEALAGTIHSVCLRLLQTWPFETGVHFDVKNVDDEDAMEAALRESMRTDWQDEGTYLPQALKAIEKSGEKLGPNDLKLIRKTALELLCGDRAIDTALCDNMTIEELIDKPELMFQLRYALIHRAAEMLAARYDVYKRENGLISFDDMLRLMRDAVRNEGSAMLKTLKERLRYGIIDEFQDTSVVQWNIFKKIFLDDSIDNIVPQNTNQHVSTAKMYIVGDPKQSIYSFQNADIESYIAAKEIIAKLGGAVYCLIDNYRSLPEMVNGYNAILCRRDHHIQARESESGGDWFLFGDGGSKISYPSTGSGGELARAPERGAPLHPLPYKAVQIIPMEGYKPEDRQRAAQAACHAIEKLKGMTISVPDGAGWEELTLDYDDFAVIVETHALADPYIEEFRKSKIPFVKYKMWGVFNSAMARDLAALLAAIHKRHSAAPRTAALLTRFFNRPPETVSSAEIFEPCPNSCCAGDDLCLAHALDHWGPLAEKQLWAQLFRDIVERTGIRQRLIRLADGERNLADLRQVVDYCVEFLYQENSNIERLIDRLKRLYNEEAQAGQDKNTHMLSTEKPSVTILTMHASKGLEFPIVFIMNSDSKKLPKGPNILSWTDDDGCCGVRRFAPYLSIAKSKKTDAASERERLGKPIELYTQDQNRERRRLLYVAMTRPKAMLFAPMRESEKDLSPRLKELLDSGDQNIALFDEQLFRRDSGQSGKPETGAPQSIRLDDIPKLSLKEFIAEETSYTQLSRKASYFNDESKDDEDYAEDAEIAGNTEDIYPENKSPKQPLKGGRLTGDALHKALEEILRADDINTIISDGDQLDKITEKHLKCGVISDDMDTDERQKAVGQASSYIRDALRAPFPLEHGGTAVIADLPKSDRVPEMEFLFPQKPHRVRGFMDLVFRVRNDRHKAHPYRYYFIDWKSDSLKSFDPESVGRYCREKNYTLQARIYARALDKYLNGILGARYSPEENLGEALYVFLRGGAARHSENLKNFAFDDGHMYIL